MQCAVQRARREKEVLPLLAEQKRKPALVALHRAAHEPELFGGDEPSPRVADDRALRFQLFEHASDRIAFAAAARAEKAADLVCTLVFERAFLELFFYAFLG